MVLYSKADHWKGTLKLYRKIRLWYGSIQINIFAVKIGKFENHSKKRAYHQEHIKIIR